MSFFKRRGPVKREYIANVRDVFWKRTKGQDGNCENVELFALIYVGPGWARNDEDYPPI